jgi:hypothetical protein
MDLIRSLAPQGAELRKNSSGLCRKSRKVAAAKTIIQGPRTMNNFHAKKSVSPSGEALQKTVGRISRRVGVSQEISLIKRLLPTVLFCLQEECPIFI